MSSQARTASRLYRVMRLLKRSAGGPLFCSSQRLSARAGGLVNAVVWTGVRQPCACGARAASLFEAWGQLETALSGLVVRYCARGSLTTPKRGGGRARFAKLQPFAAYGALSASAPGGASYRLPGAPSLGRGPLAISQGAGEGGNCIFLSTGQFCPHLSAI